jgi:outer membrane protein TolC
MNMNKWLLNGFVLITASLITGVAAAAEVLQMSMPSAVTYALQHNPDLHAAEQQMAAAQQQQLTTQAASAPVISISHTARVSDNPLDAFADKLFTRQVTTPDFQPALLNEPGSSSLYLTSLTLRWPVYSGGKIEAQQQQTDIAYQQSKLLYQRAQEKTAFHTMQAYLYVIASQKALQIAEQAVQAAQQHAATTAELAQQGRIVESDKLAAEVNLAAVKAQQAQAVTRSRHARTQLRKVMGLITDSEIMINDSWPENQAVSASDIGALMQRAADQRVDLLAAQKAIAAAGASVEVASADKKPSVNLVASSNWYDDEPGFDSQSSSLMAIASIDLYDGTTDGKVGAAKARHKEQQWRKQSLQQNVQAEVKQAFDDRQEAHARLSIAKDNVSRAKKAVRLVKKRYGQGRTILLDLLQSERMYTDARIEKLTAELDLRTSQLALSFALGETELPAVEAR